MEFQLARLIMKAFYKCSGWMIDLQGSLKKGNWNNPLRGRKYKL